MYTAKLQHPKRERLEARIDAETKALFQRAAELQGRSLTDFVISSAADAARRALLDQQALELSQRDRQAFVEALLQPPPPSARLREASDRHGRTVVET